MLWFLCYCAALVAYSINITVLVKQEVQLSLVARCFVSLNILLSYLRSFEMTPLSRTCVIPYQSSTVTIYFYLVPFLRYPALNNGVTLKSGLGAPFDRSHTSSYWRSIVTMAISCLISEVKQYIGRKIAIFYTPSTLEASVTGICMKILP